MTGRGSGRVGPAGERGSGTVWVLAAALVPLVVAHAVVQLAGAVAARHAVEQAADLAALRAAAALLAGDPCAAAASSLPSADTLLSCTADGATVRLRVLGPTRPGAAGWAAEPVGATAEAGLSVDPAAAPAAAGSTPRDGRGGGS